MKCMYGVPGVFTVSHVAWDPSAISPWCPWRRSVSRHCVLCACRLSASSCAWATCTLRTARQSLYQVALVSTLSNLELPALPCPALPCPAGHFIRIVQVHVHVHVHVLYVKSCHMHTTCTCTCRNMAAVQVCTCTLIKWGTSKFQFGAIFVISVEVHTISQQSVQLYSSSVGHFQSPIVGTYSWLIDSISLNLGSFMQTHEVLFSCGHVLQGYWCSLHCGSGEGEGVFRVVVVLRCWKWICSYQCFFYQWGSSWEKVPALVPKWSW